MKSSLRPTSLGDLDNLCQFLQRAFDSSPDAPFLNPAVMAWKYWDRRDDWEGPRSYVLERDGVIIAHAGLYPVTFAAGEVRGIHMIDWASAKDSPGAGLALVQKLNSMFDFIYSIGGSEMTCKALPAFGFIETARQWRGARPLRPLQQILQHQHRNWKLPPRLLRNALWALAKTSGNGLDESWKAEEISPGEVSRQFYSQSMAEASFSPRPPEFFEYLLRCPGMHMRLYSVQNKLGPKGHFAIGILHGQARVAGVWLRDPDRETWQAAFSLAQQAARRAGAHEIVAAGTAGPSEQLAIESGLHVVEHVPVFLLNKKGKLAVPPDFQYQLSDYDGWFMNLGSASYWT